jgi:hypothetical protein
MTTPRIDHLRELLASVGQQQTTYWKFFAPFSYRLEKELGEYLGDPTSVALSCADGNLTFNQGSDRQSGIGFKNGKFVIPLKFRLRNLKDEGETLIRVHPLFTIEGSELTAEFEGIAPISTSTENIEPLLEYIYKNLVSFCGKSTWFAENPSHYQSTEIGFTVNKCNLT